MFEVISWLAAHWIELIGVITGAGAVFFLAQNERKFFGLSAGTIGWTLGVINAVFFMILFFNQLLFADLTLNAYYFITSALGLYWWQSKRGREGKPVRPITRLSTKGWLTVVAITVIGTWAFGTFLGEMTIAQFVYIDSFTTVLSFIGQYLLARKVFDNWYLWIIADVIDIGLYAYKGLYLVVGMTAVYMVFCVMGIIKWKRDEVAPVAELVAA